MDPAMGLSESTQNLAYFSYPRNPNPPTARIASILLLCLYPEGYNHKKHIGSQNTWVVVKIMVPFWVPTIIWHLLVRVPKKGP